jgi:hypothetical protein
MTDTDQIVALLLRIIERQEAIDARLDSHIAHEEGMLSGMAGAFPARPDGKPDFDGHKIYHTALIDQQKERAVLYRELRADLAKKGLWGVLMVLGALITYWWQHEVRK